MYVRRNAAAFKHNEIVSNNRKLTYIVLIIHDDNIMIYIYILYNVVNILY